MALVDWGVQRNGVVLVVSRGLRQLQCPQASLRVVHEHRRSTRYAAEGLVGRPRAAAKARRQPVRQQRGGLERRFRRRHRRDVDAGHHREIVEVAAYAEHRRVERRPGARVRHRRLEQLAGDRVRLGDHLNGLAAVVVLRERVGADAQQKLDDLGVVVRGGQMQSRVAAHVLVVDRHAVTNQHLATTFTPPSPLGQLSLASLRGRLIEYQPASAGVTAEMSPLPGGR